ncbi:hypothetical protein HLH17_14510 [Acinetobacter sp. ANC 5380]|uniref:DUF4148 domain-containing protein n=1 Tax=Acinetobacter terrae TaxID=2731247 RepID=A0A7Y2RHY6_9GAMM|nr:hypothetical protein [Acinetobacter terrae]NNH78834.1 hypothetical protein [Acinetobacter terrae]
MQNRLFSLSLLSIFCVNIQAQDFNSPDVTSKIVQNMYDLSQKSHANTLNSASNYDKAIFDAVQRGYGGYEDAHVKFDDKDPKLSKSEKASIENKRRNSEVINGLMNGFK